MPTVLVSDSKALFAESFSVALEDHGDFQPLGPQPVSGSETLRAALELKPDLCVVDYWMPRMGGPAVASQVSASKVNTKVVILGWLTGAAEFNNALASGAAGFFLKNLRATEVIEGLRKVLTAGEPVYPPELERMKDETKIAEGRKVWQMLSSLGIREIEVLSHLAMTGVEEAAEALTIAPATVRTHVTNICRKLDTRTLMQAIGIARRYELIPP